MSTLDLEAVSKLHPHSIYLALYHKRVALVLFKKF
jgi:hypothetical protein